MLTQEIKVLDAAFQELVKRRRGQMIRRGGAGSRDFEISFPFRGHEVLVGVESGWTPDDALFMFIRHGRSAQVVNHATPFLPPRPDGVEEVVGRKHLGTGFHRDHDKEHAAAGSHGGHAATASAPAGTHDDIPRPPQPVPGFSVLARSMSFGDKMIRMVAGRIVFADPKRPGWFHVEMAPEDALPADLAPAVREPLAELLGVPQPDRLSIAMTQHIFRIRRVPFLLDTEAIDSFVVHALALFTNAVSMPPPIPVTAEPGLVMIENLLDRAIGARCGVCGEEAVTRVVQCAKCMTPHHDECWSYGGGCSIYGCGSTLKAN